MKRAVQKDQTGRMWLAGPSLPMTALDGHTVRYKYELNI